MINAKMNQRALQMNIISLLSGLSVLPANIRYVLQEMN